MKDITLWSDAGLRIALGALLVLAPRLTLTALGLPKAAETFWPRLLGTMLLALAAGAIVDVRWPGKGGPSVGGLVAINLSMSFALATGLVIGQLEIPKRGRFLMWLAAILSALLALTSSPGCKRTEVSPQLLMFCTQSRIAGHLPTHAV